MPDPTLYFYFLPAVKVHLVQNTSSLAQFCFHSIQSNPYSALMFHALLLKSKTQIQESICTQNKIHTMTDKCKYSVFTKPSYKWFIFVTKILLASSATTFAHRRTSSSNTYWLIQAKSRLNVHTATFLVRQPVIWKHTCWHILVKNLTLVYNATFPAHELTTWKDTRGHTMPKQKLQHLRKFIWLQWSDTNICGCDRVGASF